MVSGQQADKGGSVGIESKDSDSSESGNRISAEDARAQFPRIVNAALEYVRENRYDYGPKLRDADMEWTLSGAEQLDGGVVRTYIGYRPVKSFRGRSGSEYVDVDASGAVVARRQISVPTENLPWVLIGLAAASIAVLVGVQVLVWFNPFERGPDLYVAGRQLYLRSELPRKQNHVEFDAPLESGEVVRWAVSPAGEGTEMVVVEVTLVNATSGTVQMVVDRNAAQLGIVDGISLRPIDILERSYSVEEQASSRWLIPGFRIMWGSYTLNRDEQLSGHLVFEAPVGSDFSDFRWDSGDSARVSFR